MKKIFFVIVLIMLSIAMIGCTKSEYGYIFHFLLQKEKEN